jgi:hypothetical protein
VTLQSLNRWTAFGVHLAISALIAATVLVLIVWLWYPSPYFEAMGGEVLLRLLIGVDVVLGPVITLIIFDPRKPRLRYDLATIAVLQLAALAYGGWVMFEARPVYNVFVKDRFETVPANRIDGESLARAPEAFRALPLTGPRVVAARPPESAKERTAIIFSAVSGGPDVADMPHLYTPYSNAATEAARAARPLANLSRRDRQTADAVSEVVTTVTPPGRSLGYVPVRARNKDFAAVVDRNTGEVVGYIAASPC